MRRRLSEKQSLLIVLMRPFCGLLAFFLIMIAVHSWQWQLEIAVYIVSFAFSFWLAALVRDLMIFKKVAYDLADEAAASLAEQEDRPATVHVAQTETRVLPPRIIFASAIAVDEKPIVMYLGFRIFRRLPARVPSGSNHSRVTCWRIR